MTTIQVNSDGDFVENSVSDADSPNNADLVSDLYDVLQKGTYDDDPDERELSIVTLAHEVRKAVGDDTDSDSDVAKWCQICSQDNSPSELRLIEKPDSMDSEPNLGRYFWKAVEYTANDYIDFEQKYQSEADIRPLDEAGLEGSEMKTVLVEQGIVESHETVHVPVNSDGDLIPPFVFSEERQQDEDLQGSYPTYEEGIDRLQVLLNDHFEQAEVVEDSAINETSSSDSDSSSDESDTSESDSPWTNVHGVGPAMADNLEADPNAHYVSDGDFEPESRLYPDIRMPSEDSDPEESRFSEANNHGVRIRTVGADEPDVSKGELLAEIQKRDLDEWIEDEVKEMVMDGDLREAQDFLNELDE